jgi:hypothetical protein
VTGFPTNRSRANPHTTEFKSEAWNLVTESCDQFVYQDLGLPESHHLVLKLDRSTTLNTDAGRRVFPDPHGMSGSPV